MSNIYRLWSPDWNIQLLSSWMTHDTTNLKYPKTCHWPPCVSSPGIQIEPGNISWPDYWRNHPTHLSLSPFSLPWSSPHGSPKEHSKEFARAFQPSWEEKQSPDNYNHTLMAWPQLHILFQLWHLPLLITFWSHQRSGWILTRAHFIQPQDLYSLSSFLPKCSSHSITSIFLVRFT